MPHVKTFDMLEKVQAILSIYLPARVSRINTTQWNTTEVSGIECVTQSTDPDVLILGKHLHAQLKHLCH